MHRPSHRVHQVAKLLTTPANQQPGGSISAFLHGESLVQEFGNSLEPEQLPAYLSSALG